MAASELIGPVVYLMALGLFLSFFIPYALFWAQVPVGPILTFVPIILAVVLYFLSTILLPDVPYKTFASLAVIAVPLFLFPNLRVHSTIFDRIAPSLPKLFMVAFLSLFAYSFLRALRSLGVGGAVIVGAVALFSSPIVYVFLPALGESWVLSPQALCSVLVVSLSLLSTSYIQQRRFD